VKKGVKIKDARTLDDVTTGGRIIENVPFAGSED